MKQIQRDILNESSALTDEEAAWFFSLFKPEDVIRQYKPEEVIGQYKPEEVIGQFKPEERLNGLDLNTIEDYLKKQRKMKR